MTDPPDEPDLRGVIPIVVTPFGRDGSVDLDQFDRQLDFLSSAGVRWIGFGFGSEVPRLGPDELSTLMARAAGHADGELRVVGNAELTSGPAGIAAVHRVADAGADVAMVRPSGMADEPEEVVVAAIADVAADGGLPVVIQDAPQNTGVELSAATLARLLVELPQVIAVKVEPASPAPKIAAIVESLDGKPGRLIGGLGGRDFPYELQRGAVGTMPGPALPEVFQSVQHHVEEGDQTAGFELWARALPLILLCLRDPDTFLVAQKYLLARRGVLSGHALRPPHGPIDPHLLDDIEATVRHLELSHLLGKRDG